MVDLTKTDAELGEWLLAAWVEMQAGKRGVPLDAIPSAWLERLIAETSRIDSDSVKNAPLESAFRKAAAGEFETAGRMLRGYMYSTAQGKADAKMAAVGRKQRIGNHKGGKKTGQRRRDEAKAWHQDCVAAAYKLLESGKSPRDLASILAPRFGVTPTQIRAVLRKAKVK